MFGREESKAVYHTPMHLQATLLERKRRLETLISLNSYAIIINHCILELVYTATYVMNKQAHDHTLKKYSYI